MLHVLLVYVLTPSSALLWATTHLPFIMSFVLAAGSLSKLVLATDCSDTKLEDLTESYSLQSDREVPQGLRWFYCVGLGIALLCMGKFHLSFPPTVLEAKTSIYFPQHDTNFQTNAPRNHLPLPYPQRSLRALDPHHKTQTPHEPLRCLHNPLLPSPRASGLPATCFHNHWPHRLFIGTGIVGNELPE